MHSMPYGTCRPRLGFRQMAGNPACRLVGQALPADGEGVCRLMTIESGMHSMPYGIADPRLCVRPVLRIVQRSHIVKTT